MFDDITIYVRLSDILERISEEDLGKRFAPGFPKGTCTSPLRKDKHPSFGYFYKGGRWRWKDQATGEKGDLYELIRRLHNLNTFHEALQFINNTLSLGLEIQEIRRPACVLNHARQLNKNLCREVFMQVIRKPWNADEYAIWNRWCISPKILAYYNTWAASQLWMRDEEDREMKLIWTRTDANPLFFYHFPISKHIKAYRPLEISRQHKFLGNANNDTDVQGYHQCNIKERRPHMIILTKAQKEVMFYRAWNIDAMAMQGEGHVPSADFIRHLRKYCGRIISFYDNDPAGRHAAWQLRDEYEIPAFFIPKQWNSKNITDLWEKNKELAYLIIQHLCDWSSFRVPFTSFRGLLRGELESEHSYDP